MRRARGRLGSVSARRGTGRGLRATALPGQRDVPTGRDLQRARGLGGVGPLPRLPVRPPQRPVRVGRRSVDARVVGRQGSRRCGRRSRAPLDVGPADGPTSVNWAYAVLPAPPASQAVCTPRRADGSRPPRTPPSRCCRSPPVPTPDTPSPTAAATRTATARRTTSRDTRVRTVQRERASSAGAAWAPARRHWSRVVLSMPSRFAVFMAARS